MFAIINACKFEKTHHLAYVSAHPDDCSLFLGDKYYYDLLNGDSVVFILLTAGDAGLGLNALYDFNNEAYYLARQKGYIQSIIWAADAVVKTGDDGKSILTFSNYNLDTSTIFGTTSHLIQTFSYKNAKVYIFNLPDGLKYGDSNQSLKKFKNNDFKNLSSIDCLSTYNNWEDLAASINYIFKQHKISEIYTHDYDSLININDHSDHYVTGDLVLEAAPDSTIINFHLGYHSAKLESNVNIKERDIKKFLFSANAISLENYGAGSPFDEWHLQFLDKFYARTLLKI